MATFLGIRNRTNEKQNVVRDGVPTYFEPKEIRILDSETGNHAVTRLHIQHKKKVVDGKETGELLPAVVGIRIFESVSLAEALKLGATMPEDPSSTRERRNQEAEVEKTKALAEAVKKQLVADGWKAPKEAK